MESASKNQKSSELNMKSTIHYPNGFAICFLISYITFPFVIVVIILFYSILLKGPKDGKIKENAKFSSF